MLKKYVINKRFLCFICLLIFIIILFIFVCSITEKNNMITITRNINVQELSNKENINNNISIVGEDEIAEAREVLNLNEYENMPKEIEGYKVVGKISISKIDVEKYILDETTEGSLKESVTNICGQ